MSEPYQRPRWEPPSFLRPTAPRPPADQPPIYDGAIVDVTPNAVHVEPPSSPLPVNTTRYTRIVLADFVREKFFSTTQPGVPPQVTKVHVDWGRFKDEYDHTVRLFLNLPQEDRAHLQEQGYHDDVLGEEPIADDAIMEQIREAQEAEIAQAPDEITEMALRQEHREDLEAAKSEKIKITPDHLLRYPFERTFARRIDATRYKAMVERVYLSKLRTMLGRKE